jgi:hypothetical protein
MKEASGLEFAFEQRGGHTVRTEKEATSGAFDSKRRSHYAGNYSCSAERRQVELTTTRIADRAGVSVGTPYQYFPTKNSLLQALEGTSGPRSSRSGKRLRSRAGSVSCEDG